MRAARFLMTVLAAAGILCFSALYAEVPQHISSTRSFSIDGMRYTLEPSGESDISLVRRELAKDGIDLPGDPGEQPAPPPALSFVLTPERKDRPSRRFPIPASFVIRHALRLTNDVGEVEIVYGTTRNPPRESSRRLRARGWSCPVPDDRARESTVATYTQGKEKLLAFLEANGGGFLLVRRMDR